MDKHEYEEQENLPTDEDMTNNDDSIAEQSEQPDEQEPDVAAVEPDTVEDAAESDDSNEQNAEQQTADGRSDDGQQVTDTVALKKQKRSGILTYAVVMTVCFAISLGVLVAALWAGQWFGDASSDQHRTTVMDRIVYVREQDDESGVLTTQEIAELGKPSVVALSVKKSGGSVAGTGIIMREDGYIATNQHVVSDALQITVILYDGSEYEATLIGASEMDDLAVVKIEVTGLQAATFGDSSKALAGDDVVVIGHPAGLDFGWSVTTGIVSATERVVKIMDNYTNVLEKKMTLMQTSANVNGGNSGGPMFNERGEVIGIITMKLEEVRGILGTSTVYEGMGFAIPSNGAVELLSAIIETGTVEEVDSKVSSPRPVLGITGADVVAGQYYVLQQDGLGLLTEEQTAQVEDSFMADTTGILITAVTEGMDVYGKLQTYDVITAMNGKPVSNMTNLRERLYNCDAGDTITLEFIRDGMSFTVQVRLGAAQ